MPESTVLERHNELALPSFDEAGQVLVAGIHLFVGLVSTETTAVLHQICRSRLAQGSRVINLEDPLVFVPKGAKEVGNTIVVLRLNSQMANSLAYGLPDVVLFGEIRTEDCVQRAVELARAGQCVLAEMEAVDENSALERMRELAGEDVLRLISSLSRVESCPADM